MKLTRYGLRELVLVFLTMAIVESGLAAIVVRRPEILFIGIAVAANLVVIPIFIWAIAFFRDPDREIPSGDGLFVSPADGVVTDITPIGPESPIGTTGVQIGIFMSVFNVHVNRAPCDGTVTKIEHHDGAFLDVRKPEAWGKNESTMIWLKHTRSGVEYTVAFRQIAGLLARRIVTDLKVNQELTRGSRMGMIKFGSRLELLLPLALAGEIKVAIGQKVAAGSSILAAAKD